MAFLIEKTLIPADNSITSRWLDNSETRRANMTHTFKTRRVLIVEDNPNMSSLLADILLQCFDLQSEKAQDGQEALDILKDRTFDLVITDLMMPKVDGKELLKTVKQNFPHLPVILITGYEAEFNPEEEPKPDGFLLKPFKVQQIDEVLKLLPGA